MNLLAYNIFSLLYLIVFVKQYNYSQNIWLKIYFDLKLLYEKSNILQWTKN